MSSSIGLGSVEGRGGFGGESGANDAQRAQVLGFVAPRCDDGQAGFGLIQRVAHRLGALLSLVETSAELGGFCFGASEALVLLGVDPFPVTGGVAVSSDAPEAGAKDGVAVSPLAPAFALS